jgi:phospholipid/cholesterol/gamma-HCH transport system substrate-binding protein
METRASYIAVGSFVLLVSAALIGFVIWIGKVQFDEVTDRYRILFSGAVSGLQVGSPVRYLGIPVGTVTDLRIDPDDPSLVRATVEVQDGTPIKTDSVAQLEFQGLTGGVFVQISPGSAASPLLEDAPQPRIIPSRPSSIAAVVDATPILLENLVRLSGELNDLLDEENRRAIAATLANLESITRDLAEVSRRLDTTVDAGERAAVGVADLAGTLTERVPALLDRAGAVLARFDETGRLINTEIPTAGRGLRELLASVDAASDQVAALVRENREPLRDFTGSGLYEVSGLLSELRQLVSALSRFTVQLERDPTGALIRGTRGGVETGR